METSKFIYPNAELHFDFEHFGPPEYHLLKIPEGVECIGKGAFSCCSGTPRIDKLVIPPSVKRIKEAAFSNCNIKELVIEDGDISLAIDKEAFSDNLLRELNLPSRVWYVGYSSFSYNIHLTELNRGDGLKTIYKHAFFGCGLKEIDFTSFAPFATKVLDFAFAGNSIRKVVFPLPYCSVSYAETAFAENPVEKVYITEGMLSSSALDEFIGLESAKKIFVSEGLVK